MPCRATALKAQVWTIKTTIEHNNIFCKKRRNKSHRSHGVFFFGLTISVRNECKSPCLEHYRTWMWSVLFYPQRRTYLESRCTAMMLVALPHIKVQFQLTYNTDRIIACKHFRSPLVLLDLNQLLNSRSCPSHSRHWKSGHKAQTDLWVYSYGFGRRSEWGRESERAKLTYRHLL